MGAVGEAWASRVAAQFSYLGDFGFELAGIEDGSFWEGRATYRSATSAIAAIRSVEFGRVEIQLMRLVNGELPEYPIFIVDSVPVNTFYLDDLVVLRSPTSAAEVRAQGGLSDAEADAQLEFWSAALLRNGFDFLQGDLSVLDELEHIVRERAANSPQQVQVWMPEGTSSEEAAAEVERVQATVPEGVKVFSRWYRRRRRHSN